MRRFPIDFLFWAANEAGLIKGCKNHDVDDFYLLGVHLMSFGMSEKIARSHRIQLASPTSEVFELLLSISHGVGPRKGSLNSWKIFLDAPV
jgi:hypothetical protein